jgi:hypothetical protein
MDFTIHFRGVAMLVAKGETSVTEILFPNAETEPPPNGDPGDLKADGRIVGRNMKHADGSAANPHFAGAMIVGPGLERTYRKLAGRIVKPVGTSGSPPTPPSDFFEQIPPLAKVITNAGSRLKLLDPTLTANHKRIATRFILDTGNIAPVMPGSNGTWLLAGGLHGPSVKTRQFSLGATWTVTADEPLRFDVLGLDGNPIGDKRIELDADHREVYFFNLDVGLPTDGDLAEETLPSTPGLVDDDFKWVYALLDGPSGPIDWKIWLRSARFPAPQLVGLPESKGKPHMLLIPVSTCFESVWTGE